MIRLFYDLGFILRNWRYLHAHHALWAELRDWLVDYDRPQQVQTNNINIVNVGTDPEAVARIASRQQTFRWGS